MSSLRLCVRATKVGLNVQSLHMTSYKPLWEASQAAAAALSLRGCKGFFLFEAIILPLNICGDDL